MTLHNRLALVASSCVRSSTLLSKIERRVKIFDSFDRILYCWLRTLVLLFVTGSLVLRAHMRVSTWSFKENPLVLLNHTMLKQKVYLNIMCLFKLLC